MLLLKHTGFEALLYQTNAMTLHNQIRTMISRLLKQWVLSQSEKINIFIRLILEADTLVTLYFNLIG